MDKPMTFLRTILVLMLIPGLGCSAYSQLGGKQVPSAPSCGITLKVVGGQFSPGSCRFEIISRGQECKSNAGCPPDYALSMKDNARTHIMEVTLFNFRSFAKETFRVDPAQNLRDFKGQLLDESAVARNLLKGEVSLEPIKTTSAPGDQKVRVSLDLSFSNGIHIQGSGEVPVAQVSAP
jgi:hypothetical protein